MAPSGKCAVVYQGDLHSRFFYLYVADDIGGGAWDGSNFMCTRDESFTIFGVEDCLARGYDRTGFFEVDTQNKPEWTLQLADQFAQYRGHNRRQFDVTGPGNAPASRAIPAAALGTDDGTDTELTLDTDGNGAGTDAGGGDDGTD